MSTGSAAVSRSAVSVEAETFRSMYRPSTVDAAQNAAAPRASRQAAPETGGRVRTEADEVRAAHSHSQTRPKSKAERFGKKEEEAGQQRRDHRLRLLEQHGRGWIFHCAPLR
jgi:hypothetical protein